MGALCEPVGKQDKQPDINRDRAIEIARKEVTFKPDNVEAVLTTAEQRSVWRVTFKGRGLDQRPGLSEMVSVDIDARTGEIVSASMP